jgi:hypothetical protein
MRDDLVKRLRKWDYGESTWGLLEDAANRIEKLEAALREIAEMGYWDDDSTRIARKALEGKDD